MRRLLILWLLLPFSVMGQVTMALEHLTVLRDVERCQENRVPDDFGEGPILVGQFRMSNQGNDSVVLVLGGAYQFYYYWLDGEKERRSLPMKVADNAGMDRILLAPREEYCFESTAKMGIYPEIVNIGGDQVADCHELLQTLLPTLAVRLEFGTEVLDCGGPKEVEYRGEDRDATQLLDRR